MQQQKTTRKQKWLLYFYTLVSIHITAKHNTKIHSFNITDILIICSVTFRNQNFAVWLYELSKFGLNIWEEWYDTCIMNPAYFNWNYNIYVHLYYIKKFVNCQTRFALCINATCPLSAHKFIGTEIFVWMSVLIF